MKKYLVVAMLLSFLITSCATYTHRSGDNSNIETDSRYCQATANANAPTYICQNPFMCTPEETSYAIGQLSKNNAVYDQCMIQRGYVVQQ
tara:strand:+ start:233 stop:502 length:270 start_codon:yes stop_codon:yes gene_type:complete